MSTFTTNEQTPTKRNGSYFFFGGGSGFGGGVSPFFSNGVAGFSGLFLSPVATSKPVDVLFIAFLLLLLALDVPKKDDNQN